MSSDLKRVSQSHLANVVVLDRRQQKTQLLLNLLNHPLPPTRGLSNMNKTVLKEAETNPQLQVS